MSALKAELAECIRKVPDRVQNGSVQTAVAYKKWAAKAVKVMDNTRASDLQIQQMIQQHKGFQ